MRSKYLQKQKQKSDIQLQNGGQETNFKLAT